MRLKLRGFKATDRDVDLARLNIISAPNGSGKSAVADAIRFLALGYVPALGKTEAATAMLMSNGALAVELELQDGRVAARSLERDGKGLRSTVRASWVRGSRAEHEAAILALFGRDVTEVAESLDVRELLSIPPTQRAARIEKIVGTGSGPGDLSRRVARACVARLLGREVEELPEKFSEAMPLLAEGRADVIATIGHTMTASLDQHGIPATIEWANEMKREAEKSVRHRHAARTELESRIDSEVTVAIDDLEIERARMREAIGADQERQRRTIERGKQRDAATSEHAKAVSTLTDAEVELDRLTTSATEMIAALEGKVFEYDEQVGVLKAQSFGSPVDVERIKQLRDQLVGIVDEPVEDLTRYEKTVEQLEDELAGVKASPWAEVRGIAESIALLEAGDTQSQHGLHQASDRLIALADANGASTVEVEKGLAAAREALSRGGERAAAAAQRNVANEEQRRKLSEELQRLNAQSDNATKSIEEREKKRAGEIDLIVRKKSAAIEEIRSQREKLRLQVDHVHALKQKAASLESRVDALRGEDVPAADVPGLDELARIEDAIKRAREHEGVQREIKLIIAEIDRLDAMVDVTKAIEFALQRIREEELQAHGAGIKGKIRRFLSAGGRGEEPFMYAAKGVCDIGWIRPDGRRVSVQAMSGGEYALFCAALTAAILSERGGDLRVLLVEAAEADEATVEQLLAGIGAMGALTHALVLTAHDVRAVVSDFPDWNVVMRIHGDELKAVAA